MMMFKDVVDEILRVCRATNDNNFKTIVKNLINIKYTQLCKEFSVKALRDKITLDFTTATTSGLWLPSDLAGIDCVRDEDEVEFYERDRSDIEDDEFGYRYYRYKGSTTPLLTGEDLILEYGEATFMSDTVDAYIAGGGTIDGQYIRFGNEKGYYEITSDTYPYTFEPTYYGPAQSSAEFRIRPEEDERMIIIDDDETILQDRSMDVYYWKYPIPMYRDSDFILLPSAVALQLMVLRELPEAKALRPVSENEIEEEKAKMIKLNPMFSRKSNPRDKNNNIFDLDVTRKFFTSR